MADSMPKHIGIIMDGNRRWARQRGLPGFKGHLKGYENLKDLAFYILLDRKIPFLSAYAFSMENWSRTEEEVRLLMSLVERALRENLKSFHEAGIKILILGARQKLTPALVDAIEAAEETTRHNKNGTLAICFNYSGQQEIVDAVQRLRKSRLQVEAITPEKLSEFLYHPEVPPLDLIVRTSGEKRLSGYMLWRAAYAELLFLDKYWPDFKHDDIDLALAEYASRQRRYGK